MCEGWSNTANGALQHRSEQPARQARLHNMHKIAPTPARTHLRAVEHNEVFEITVPVLDEISARDLPQDVAHDGKQLQVYFSSIEAAPRSILLATLGRAEDRGDERKRAGCKQ